MGSWQGAADPSAPSGAVPALLLSHRVASVGHTCVCVCEEGQGVCRRERNGTSPLSGTCTGEMFAWGLKAVQRFKGMFVFGFVFSTKY